MSRAREIALEAFKKQAQSTLGMGDPIEPIETALLQYAKEEILKLKAHISANFMGMADVKDHSGGCDTCGYGSTIEGSEAMSMEKISDVFDEYLSLLEPSEENK